MTPPSLGFWFIHRTPLFEPTPARAIARLLTDPRWPWQPSLVRPMHRTGGPIYPWPSGKVAAVSLGQTIEDIMRSDQAEAIHLVLSRKDSGNHAWCVVDNGRLSSYQERIAFPMRAVGMCRSAVPPGTSIDAWLELVRGLAVVTTAVHGVIWVDTDERPIVARQFLSGTSQPKQPPDHPANESSRIARVRDVLGERYVRPPGWATFLRRAHVDAVGGRDRLLAAVAPPVVHDVGDLLYLQLSASVADALAPETEARRRALAELLAPITVPLEA
ncbi:MAG: hypothetical protein IPL61_34030 [Myxococcales bacterium]|nr:hypothetical protein [Myxococcales bacterium]